MQPLNRCLHFNCVVCVTMCSASSVLFAAAPQPTASEKFLKDVDRKAQQLFKAADADRDQSINEERITLDQSAEQAAAKLVRARNIAEQNLSNYKKLLARQEGARKPRVATDAGVEKADAQTDLEMFVVTFRHTVATAAEAHVADREARLQAARERNEPNEELIPQAPPLVDPPPFQARRNEYDDDYEERRLRERLRDAELEAEYFRRQQAQDRDRERYRRQQEWFRQQRQNQSNSNPVAQQQPKKPTTLREKIGYDKGKPSDNRPLRGVR